MNRMVVGVDLVEIERFRRFLAPLDLEQLRALYTPSELAHAQTYPDAVPSLAARFAGKEAVIKALAGLDGFCLDWCEIEVSSESGRPRLQLYGAVAGLAGDQGVTGLEISLSHSRTLAIAQVVGIARG